MAKFEVRQFSLGYGSKVIKVQIISAGTPREALQKAGYRRPFADRVKAETTYTRGDGIGYSYRPLPKWEDDTLAHPYVFKFSRISGEYRGLLGFNEQRKPHGYTYSDER